MFRNPFSRLRLVAVTAMLAVAAVGTSGGVSGQSPPPADSPVGYAQATFDAWLAHDAAAITYLTEPAAADLLLNRQPGGETWSGPPLCEGAAGSTYCTWASESSQLLLRVANEAASNGQPHAVTEAAFIPPVDGVAIWPFSTQEAADNTQSSVNEGHSPWMLDPAAVATTFAGSVLYWEDPIAEATADPAMYHLIDRVSGVVIDVELGQPAVQGEGGIWAVVRTWPPQTGGMLPPPAQTWDAAAVWPPSTVDYDGWVAVCGGSPGMMTPEEGVACGLKVMEQAGASEEAKAFLSANGYFLESFQELGTVDYGRGSAPWMNMGRPTQQLFLNGSPPLFEAPVDVMETWRQDPSYAEVAASDEYASTWIEYGTLTASTVGTEPGVAQEIDLAVPIQSCRACASLGSVNVRYSFDEAGALVNQTLLPFTPPAP